MSAALDALEMRVSEYRGRGAGEKSILLSERDAARLGVSDGDPLRVSSASGRVALLAARIGSVGEGFAGIDRFTRESLGVKPGDVIRVERVWRVSRAARLRVAPLRPGQPIAREKLSEWLRGRYAALGELLIPSNAPVTRVVVVDSEPSVEALLVTHETILEVDDTPVAHRAWLTGRLLNTPVRTCRGDRIVDTLVLGVEPGPCAWIWRGTETRIMDEKGLLEALVASGLLEDALRWLSGGHREEAPLAKTQHLLTLLLYLLLSRG